MTAGSTTVKTPRRKRNGVKLAALKARLGGLVLYVKPPRPDAVDIGVIEVKRCILHEIESKTVATAKGETTAYTVVLLPDMQHIRDALAPSTLAGEPRARTQAEANRALIEQRISLDGVVAETCLFLTYEGVEDGIWDHLGPVDPTLGETFP